MLGRFELHSGATLISESSSRSRKIWNLLAYILIHRGQEMTQQEMIEALWPNEDSSNPANALKTTLYRLRAMLAPLQEAVGEELILSHRNSYAWNKAVHCELDVDLFEQFCKDASDEGLPDGERVFMLMQAQELYQGDFLPKFLDELWILSLNAHYHSLYLAAAKSLAGLLERGGLFDEMAEICRKALDMDGLDDRLHCLLIRAYINRGDNAAALSHYEYATDLLYRSLGVKPSKEMQDLYRGIMKTRKSLETDLGIIQQQLQETEKKRGAFVCDYGFFQEIYRLESRRSIRSGVPVSIGLITVSSPTGDIPNLELLNAVMDPLLDCIQTSLRKGDVLARYSVAQFVLMLPSTRFEDGDMVIRRILDRFAGRNRQRFLQIHYTLQQMDLGLDVEQKEPVYG